MTSDFRGVYYYKNRWAAKYNSKHLGLFPYTDDGEILAALAYDKYLRRQPNPHNIKPNFPVPVRAKKPTGWWKGVFYLDNVPYTIAEVYENGRKRGPGEPPCNEKLLEKCNEIKPYDLSALQEALG